MTLYCLRLMTRMLPVICVFAEGALGGEDKERSLWEQLAGEWEVVEVQQNGKVTTEASVKAGDRVRFNSGKMAAINSVTNDVTYELTVALEHNQSPAGIKLTGRVGRGVVDFAGIIEVEGDRLRVCTGVRGYSVTPNVFRTQPKDGLTLKVYRRRQQQQQADIVSGRE